MIPELHCLYSLNQQMLSLYPSMELKYLHPMPDNCSARYFSSDSCQKQPLPEE